MIDIRKSLYTNFLEFVEKDPAKNAIEYANRKVSYSDLHLAAAKINAHLPRREEQGQLNIAILLEDRIEAIQAIFGVLMAGHCFVPLDADDPDDRLRLIVSDSQPKALLTTRQGFDKASALVGQDCPIILCDELMSEAGEAALFNASADDYAYIFYTSGSTGKPKGVCQTQRNLQYFVSAYSQKVDLTAIDRVSLLYSLSFSASNMDIFGSLLNGATLCAYDMRSKGIPGLSNWLEDENITILHAVPTVFRKLLEAQSSSICYEKIKSVDLGGEVVTGSDVRLFHQFFPKKSKLINHLAATEISVIAQFDVPDDFLTTQQIVPAGISPQEVEVWLEGQDGHQVSTGEVGRIVISSPYLSPGYWERPDLNAKVFSQHPIKKGWRVYKTEDNGQFNADGHLVFIGREGTRVKIRGQSVDLNEVEAAVLHCHGVREVAVILSKIEEAAEGDILVAYVVCDHQNPRTALDLRRSLLEAIPQYMIPSVFSFQKNLPITASGKIDREALKKLKLQVEDAPKEVATFQTDLEREVASIFEEILKRSNITSRDDFFLVGGDSMLAVQLQIKLSGVAQRDVSLKDIFHDSTVEGLAKMVSASHPDSVEKGPYHSILVPLREKGNYPPLFLVHGRLGQAHVSPRFLSIIGEDQSIYSLQARGLSGLEQPSKSIESMALDYVAAIRSIQPNGPYFLGALCAGGYIAMRMAEIIKESGETLLPILLIDPPPPPFSFMEKKYKSDGEMLTALKKKEIVDSLAFSINSRLIQRTKQGRFSLDLANQALRKAAILVALYFEFALASFKPKPYKGEVYLISTKDHLSQNGWGDVVKRKSVFGGSVSVFEVPGTHREILDASNMHFAKQLSHAVNLITNKVLGE